MKTTKETRLNVRTLIQNYNKNLLPVNELSPEDKAIDYLAEILVEAFMDYKKHEHK